jgi:pyruvate carboxylase subunit B
MLLMELLPNVANGFLRRRRAEEYAAVQESNKQEVAEEAPKAAEEPITGETINAMMGGRIIEVNVKAGDAVKKGQVVLVYEAMKMENDVTAPKDAVVKRVFVKTDDVVGVDAVLIEFAD